MLESEIPDSESEISQVSRERHDAVADLSAGVRDLRGESSPDGDDVALLKAKATQPVFMDDFADTQISSAVRNLYLDPDAPRPMDPFDAASSSTAMINQKGEAIAADTKEASVRPELLLCSPPPCCTLRTSSLGERLSLSRQCPR
jgi:hypothetical protein